MHLFVTFRFELIAIWSKSIRSGILSVILLLSAYLDASSLHAQNTSHYSRGSDTGMESVSGTIGPKTSEKALIPVDQIGATAEKKYTGDGLAIIRTSDGAQVRCTFQKLIGTVSMDGLWLRSNVKAQVGAPFRIRAETLGRSGSVAAVPLDVAGVVQVEAKLARFIRSGLTEEYSVGVDGVRQDFLVANRPVGNGDTVVELSVVGAEAVAEGAGMRLLLDDGRKLAYERLQVSDATGRRLSARMQVLGKDRIAVTVQDQGAIYPIRVDPTFSDANWVGINPGYPGTNSTINAAVVDSSGQLYVGGFFTFIGSVEANHIAKWDGSNWSQLGSGVDGAVWALAVIGTDLYAGGYFTSAGGTSATRIAKWNGSTWSALGTGMDNSVWTLAVVGTDLYAGGSFLFAGGTLAASIAKWDGSSWSALGSGMNGDVLALAAFGSNLYAGGSFTTAGGTGANSIAKWNGSAWSALGSGLGTNGVVFSLALAGTDLYAGGRFSTAGGSNASCIAKWDGGSWSAVGSGMNGGVFGLVVMDSALYACGEFTIAGGTSVNNIAKWDGGQWSALGSGLENGNGVSALAVVGTNLYAGGDFTTAGGVSAIRLAKWNGSNWSAIMPGINNSITALAVMGTDLYLAGNFTAAVGMNANRIAKWDGSTWSPLGAGINGTINSLSVMGTDLYAGGTFVTAGGVSANRVAKWNGSIWSALGLGMDGDVRVLATVGTNLYAGGSFTTAGGVGVNRIAKWDGSTWSALGSGVNSDVAALAVSGIDLYVGGAFTSASGTSASCVAKWNGSNWSALGSGMNGAVLALTVNGPNLYAGGWFTAADGKSASRIAQWDGSNWSALGSGMNGDVLALAAIGSNLYAGGDFTSAGGTNANYIARWDGSNWSALGSGMNNGVNALSVMGTDLYVGGDFLMAGTTVSPFVAKLVEIVPEVNSLSGLANGIYKTGDTLSLAVNFSAPVSVTGTPRMSFIIGAATHYAAYSSGSGTTSIIFSYIVQAGDSDADGITVNSPLELSGGSMKSTGNGSNAVRAFTPPITAGILIDGVVPLVSSVAAPSSGAYATGQGLDFIINWSENVTVTTAGGTPSIGLTVGSTMHEATYLSGSGTPALIFRYTVHSGDEDSDGITMGSLGLNGGAIRDVAGNDATLTLNSVGTTTAVLVDTTPPLINSILTASAAYGSSFNYGITALHYPTSYSATGLPSGLSVNAGTGGISGTPTQVGAFNVSLAALNANGTSPTVALVLTVAKGQPVVVWDQPTGINFGTPLSETQLNAATSVAGTFSYSPASGSYPSPGTVQLTATFTPTDPDNYQSVTTQHALVVTYQNDSRIPAGFDLQGYYALNLNVRQLYQSDLYGAWLYYHDHGIYQGEVFDDLFRVEEYLTLYPELFAIFGDDLGAALDHWLSTGRIEGKLGRIPLEFSADGYFTRNPDVATAVNNDPLLAWGHYWLYGIYEGRAYDDELRVFEYLAINADLTAAFVNDWRQAALHWMRYGRTEGRLGRLPLTFSVAEYLNRSPDVAAVWGTNPTTVFLHFWLYGIDENRTYDDLFRPDEYMTRYPDVAAAVGGQRSGAFKHWVRYGLPGGRIGRYP